MARQWPKCRQGCGRARHPSSAALSLGGPGAGCGANGRAFQGCVRFKSLEDLALDVVGRTVARVSAEEHMANYQAARALLEKGNSELRNSSRARRVRERGSNAKKSAVKKAKPKK